MTLGTRAEPGLRVTYHGVTYHADTVAGGAAYELFSDVPEDGFRRNPQVGALMPYRRFVHVTDAGCTVIRDEGAWLRVRLTRPDPDNVVALGAQCGERGIYEAWAPAAEVTDHRSVDTVYQL